MNNLRIPTMQAVNTATNLKQHLERSIPGSETSQPITFMVPSESERARENVPSKGVTIMHEIIHWTPRAQLHDQAQVGIQGCTVEEHIVLALHLSVVATPHVYSERRTSEQASGTSAARLIPHDSILAEKVLQLSRTDLILEDLDSDLLATIRALEDLCWGSLCRVSDAIRRVWAVQCEMAE